MRSGRGGRVGAALLLLSLGGAARAIGVVGEQANPPKKAEYSSPPLGRVVGISSGADGGEARSKSESDWLPRRPCNLSPRRRTQRETLRGSGGEVLRGRLLAVAAQSPRGRFSRNRDWILLFMPRVGPKTCQVGIPPRAKEVSDDEGVVTFQRALPSGLFTCITLSLNPDVIGCSGATPPSLRLLQLAGAQSRRSAP